MKKNLFQLSLLFSLCAAAFCGCTDDDEPTVATTDGSALTIHATADGFNSADGTAQTRASESDYTTTFLDGDAIGVFAVRNNNVIADCNNVKLTCSSANWSGNTIYKYSDATYFAYYPYNESMSGKTSVDAIVSAFNTIVANTTDQNTYTQYTHCDLMTASGNGGVSLTGTSLSFSFKHQMSLIEISLPMQEYKTSNDNDAYKYSTPVSDATFSLTPSSGSSAITIKPYPMGNGIYRYIVPAGTSTVSGTFKTFDSKTIKYTKNNLSLSAGNYKRLNVTTNTILHPLAVGDFYYSDGSIYPYDASNPPSKDCVGVVYCVDKNFITNSSTKKLEGGYTHALVVALKNPSPTTYMREANNWYIATTYTPIEYEKEVPAPSASSGWYMPNLDELKYICWGNNSTEGTEGRQFLERQFSKLNNASDFGGRIGDSYYWSMTDWANDGFFVLFSNGEPSSGTKNADSYSRASLAF